MRIILTSALAATLLLSACGNGSSGSSPFGWFGGNRAERASPNPTNPLIPRRSAFKRPEAVYDGVPLAQVLELSVERTPGGAIVRAKGLSATLGAFDVRLVPDEAGSDAQNATLEYTLKARYSKRSRPAAPQRSREISVAKFLSDEALEGVRTIRVKAAQNARSVRR